MTRPRIASSSLPVYVLLAACVLGAAAAAATPRVATPRVVAIGDVHGAYESLVEVLQAADLVDRDGRWVGGDATLVQVGDFLDRGAGVFEVMDLLMRLQEEAPRHGGRVIVILGNHEVMNLLGVVRDVSPEVFARLAGRGSEERTERLYRAAAELYRGRHRGEEPPPEFAERWKRKHPPGLAEYRRLLGPDGRYGRWLRTLPAAVRLDDMFFMHAGLDPQMDVRGADEINAWVEADLAFFDGYRERLASDGLILPVASFGEVVETAEALARGGVALASLDGERVAVRRQSKELVRREDEWTLTDLYGPLWFRGFSKWGHLEGARSVKTLARVLGVEHFIVGHTPSRDREIHQRFAGAVFLTDTGMLSAHYRGGRPSALERVGESWTAIYLDGRDVLLGPGTRQAVDRGWRGPDGEALPFEADEQALEFLRRAEVVSTKEIGGGSNRTLKVLLEQDGVRAHAAFRTVDMYRNRVNLGDQVVTDFHDSYRYEVAAYELSRFLGLDHIPPAALREIDGEKGSIQLWVEDAISESQRVAAKTEPPDWTAWYRQLQTMRIFDSLIFNFDRNRGNILIDADWKLWMIDHTRSFRTSADVPEIATVTNCEKDLWRRLRELDEEALRQRLDAYLNRRQIKALLKRRDKVVEHVKGLIERFGEEYVIFDLDEVPTPRETGHLADGEIESFLARLPDTSEAPAELRTSAE